MPYSRIQGFKDYDDDVDDADVNVSINVVAAVLNVFDVSLPFCLSIMVTMKMITSVSQFLQLQLHSSNLNPVFSINALTILMNCRGCLNSFFEENGPNGLIENE